MQKRVLVLGDANIDIVLSGLMQMPQLEQDVLATGLDVLAGGQASTIARSLSRLGEEVTIAAKVGDDDFGRQVEAQLASDGVDTSALLVDPSSQTGVTVVLSSGTQRAYATYGGALFELHPEDVDVELLKRVDHLHLGSFYYHRALRPAMAGLFQEAKSLGLTTSMDPGWDPVHEWNTDIIEVLKHVDVFLPNLVEAMAISGADTVLQAAETLGELSSVVVIKMGADGCLAWDRGHFAIAPAFEVEVKDVTSAGDVFNAGYLCGFFKRWDAWHCAQIGNACGAIAATKVGSQGIISGMDEVSAFLEEHLVTEPGFWSS